MFVQLSGDLFAVAGFACVHFVVTRYNCPRRKVEDVFRPKFFKAFASLNPVLL
jgi:hypothetical protein